MANFMNDRKEDAKTKRCVTVFDKKAFICDPAFLVVNDVMRFCLRSSSSKLVVACHEGLIPKHSLLSQYRSNTIKVVWRAKVRS